MARRSRRTHKRRTARLVPVYKIVSFIIICAAIGIALSLFFKIETISVSGNARYSAAQVTEASGISLGDNMFLLNKYDAGEKICAELPYVESVQIRRQLPTGMTIRITECISPTVLQQDGKCYLLGTGGKIVDEVTVSKIQNLPRLIGVRLQDPIVGLSLQIEDDPQKTVETLVLDLLGGLNEKGMLDDIQRIELTDSQNVMLQYMDRFQVFFPRDADVDYKLDYLRAVVERLEVNETGYIDMTEEGKASFTPF